MYVCIFAFPAGRSACLQVFQCDPLGYHQCCCMWVGGLIKGHALLSLVELVPGNLVGRRAEVCRVEAALRVEGCA
jgi:hypothetical protein